MISINFDAVSPTSGVALSFTESPMFINPLASDDPAMSAINNTYDGVENILTPLETGLWTQPESRLRGGFRYLTIVSTSDSELARITLSLQVGKTMPLLEMPVLSL